MKGSGSRRNFLKGAGVAAGALGLGSLGAEAETIVEAQQDATHRAPLPDVESFWGIHQAGILTPAQSHTYFAAFDVTADKAAAIIDMLRLWTTAAERMARSETAEPITGDLSVAAGDSGEALGLRPSRLTLTFGFGPTFFTKDGKDRFGLAHLRPAAFIDMPAFNGEQLVAAHTGGDLSVQACADDPQVAFHAVRQLARIAYGVAQLRWAQAGFASAAKDGGTPRNLMGFKDGTQNPIAPPPHGIANATRPMLDPEKILWVGNEAPAWMQGGTYLAVRRIRVSLEHWDRSDTDFQQQVIGRQKSSGAPLGGHDEFEPLDLKATDKDGNFVVPETAHVRLGAAASTGGAQILRRGYSYNDGVSFIAERWPPWRQGMLYDAGLLFVAYQRDLRNGFVKIFDMMSKIDALNQFTTHVGGGFFACPRGVAEGEFIGQALFEAV